MHLLAAPGAAFGGGGGGFLKLFAGWVLSYELRGFERLGRPGQLIFGQPPFAGCAVYGGYVRDVNYVVKKIANQSGVMISPIKACAYIPNDESEALLEQADAVLKGGQKPADLAHAHRLMRRW